jgi:hypothetical protein
MWAAFSFVVVYRTVDKIEPMRKTPLADERIEELDEYLRTVHNILVGEWTVPLSKAYPKASAKNRKYKQLIKAISDFRNELIKYDNPR